MVGTGPIYSLIKQYQRDRTWTTHILVLFKSALQKSPLEDQNQTLVGSRYVENAYKFYPLQVLTYNQPCPNKLDL